MSRSFIVLFLFLITSCSQTKVEPVRVVAQLSPIQSFLQKVTVLDEELAKAGCSLELDYQLSELINMNNERLPIDRLAPSDQLILFSRIHGSKALAFSAAASAQDLCRQKKETIHHSLYFIELYLLELIAAQKNDVSKQQLKELFEQSNSNNLEPLFSHPSFYMSLESISKLKKAANVKAYRIKLATLMKIHERYRQKKYLKRYLDRRVHQVYRHVKRRSRKTSLPPIELFYRIDQYLGSKYK